MRISLIVKHMYMSYIQNISEISCSRAMCVSRRNGISKIADIREITSDVEANNLGYTAA